MIHCNRLLTEMDERCIRLAYESGNKSVYTMRFELPVPEGKSRLDYETLLIAPEPEDYDKFIREAEDLLVSAQNLPVADEVEEIMKTHIEDFLQEQIAMIKVNQKNPSSVLLNALESLIYYFDMDQRDRVFVSEVIRRKLRQFSELSVYVNRISTKENAEGTVLIVNAYNRISESLRFILTHLDSGYSWISGTLKSEITDLINRVLYNAEQAKEKLPKVKGMSGELSGISMEKRDYEELLKDKFGITIEDIIRESKEATEKAREEMLRAASNLPVPDISPKTIPEAKELLDRYAGNYKSPGEVLAKANEYMQRVRAYTKSLIWLPEEKCEIRSTGGYSERIPIGAFEEGAYESIPLTGYYYLNLKEYQNLTDGYLKLLAVHEVYMGHHLQFLYRTAGSLPMTIKLGAKGIKVIEGFAARSEMLGSKVFEEDPFYYLFACYRQNELAVRLKAELMAMYYGNSLDEIAEVYQEEAGMPKAYAIGYASAHQNFPGYFTCYYFGANQLNQWYDEMGMSSKEFTESVLSAGIMSMENVYRYLKMPKEERNRFSWGEKTIL